MARYILRRLAIMVPMMVLISILCFAVIKLQPGDFTTQYLTDPRVTPEMVAQIRARLGLDQPAPLQYWTWVKGILTRGDFGYSFAYKRPVQELIWERLGWTVVVAGATMLFSWVVAIPIGIYSATHKYSFLDYFLTFIGFIGVSIPSFFLALVLMYLSLRLGGTAVGGLFSQQYIGAPWTWAKFVDLLKHLWIPLIAIGLSGTAGLIRLMRANLLDVLQAQYVVTARAKGLSERVVIYKHAVRNAINPLITIFGFQLGGILGGASLTEIVMNWPGIGSLMLNAVQGQDYYLVMGNLVIGAIMLILGNLTADVLLAASDPRIRYE